jgi:hypothetical protein
MESERGSVDSAMGCMRTTMKTVREIAPEMDWSV